MTRELFPPENPEYPIRIAMGIEYQGTNYKGWQIQNDDTPTIQGELTKAISKVANHPVQLFCAGRTDAMVHGTHQVIHFDTKAIRKEYGWNVGPNGLLPKDISIQWAKQVDHHFHARFSAQYRRYRYVIYNHAMPPGVNHFGVTWHKWPLDADLMHEAAQHLVGTHDFSSYRAEGCQAASPVRTVMQLSVRRYGKMIVLDALADGFLYHMIRNIVGVLLDVGTQKHDTNWTKEVLEFRNRRLGGVTAKPYGLYFVDVGYDPIFEIPQSPLGPYFLSWLE